MDLSNFGLKNTKARECLINLLKESKDPKTAEELYLNLRYGNFQHIRKSLINRINKWLGRNKWR